jgi:hypothetical protein
MSISALGVIAPLLASLALAYQTLLIGLKAAWLAS